MGTEVALPSKMAPILKSLSHAAHAGCFTMFLAFVLDGQKLTAEQLDTKAALTLEMSPEGSFDITSIRLTLTAKIPGLTSEKFDQLVAQAKAGCAVSKLLKAEIHLDATLIP
jgi:lipoyl-dependent peroxiredoxin